jgi:hypothetical protein
MPVDDLPYIRASRQPVRHPVTTRRRPTASSRPGFAQGLQVETVGIEPTSAIA